MEVPASDTQLEAEQPPSLPSGDPPAELQLSLSEQSASESAPEDQLDREEDSRAEEPKAEKSPGCESKVLGCKRGSPKAGEAWGVQVERDHRSEREGEAWGRVQAEKGHRSGGAGEAWGG